MSRDDDFEGSQPRPENPPPDPDRFRFVKASGELTIAGENAIREFRFVGVEPDDDCRITRDELERAFEAWPGGFSLEDLADNSFIDIICCTAPWELIRGADPKLPESFRLRYVEKCENEFEYRARLVDDLGLTAFDPSDDASTAVTYLVDTLLPLHGVHMFVALPETLKTWLADRIAIDVSQGRPALGRFATRQGRAVIVDFELGSLEAKRRLRMLGADGRVFHKSFPKHGLADERFWTELRKVRPWFVVIDGLGAGQSGGFGELDSRFAEPLGRAARFAEENECTFLFLHHSPKMAAPSDAESLFRGTGAIRAKVDLGYYFRRLPDGPNGEVRSKVTCVKARKGVAPATFAIELTDARGVELYEAGAEPKPPAPVPMTDEDRLYAFLASKPGASGNGLARKLKLKRATVSALLGSLETAGRITRSGNGRSTTYAVVSPIVSSNEAGNAPTDTIAEGPKKIAEVENR